ncbi:MAG: tRNA (pseudouridine(54)-N(1))-methyltransferase TrmY [Thermoplasmata archaeon]|nr:tRNA (pseudouridine(54)-N(1))-methyltransferase TrmY [Thermoplasmata archaeon]
MPTFVIVGHKCNTDGLFTLNDLPGSTGRLDILLRCVNASFFLSNGLRKDVETYLVLLGGEDAPKTVRFCGSELKYLNPDERSTAALVKNALMQKIGVGGEVRSSPGIYVSRRGLKDVLGQLGSRDNTRFIHLKENGKPIRDAELDPDIDVIFVMGGQFDLTEDEEEMVMGYEPMMISLGPLKLHASHCIALVLNELDIRKDT